MQQPISIEFFPPKTPAGMEKLQRVMGELSTLNPQYVSVTYGAGGSTQEGTFAVVDWLVSQGIEVAPHLSCIGSSRAEILDILERYREQGIQRLVALRGDLPSGAGLGGQGELRYANELVTLIRETQGQHFHIEVAAYPEFHPQAPSAEADLLNFQRKVDAGAQAAISQYFYNADAYFHFVGRCRDLGMSLPIVPGIMPITNYSQLARFSDSCGAEIPRWLRKQLEAYGDDSERIRALGTQVVTDLCRRLLDGGAPGLHFYAMNQSAPILAIMERLEK
jgi:methylenetetrahydrofolate reductase (NADPH)